MVRAILLAMAAIAMFLAPMAMQSGMAMAAALDDHHAPAAQAGHCDETVPQDDDTPGPSMQSCVAMCSAIAPAGVLPVEVIAFADPPAARQPESEHRLFLADLPTPPPRAG